MKLKIALFITALCTCIGCAFAQDILTLNTGEEVEVVVIEIDKTDVRYRKFSNQNGPIYSLPKSDIFMIKYENGEKDVFGAPKVETQVNKNFQYSFSKKEPVISCMLSFLLPGGGQYYNGEYKKGGIMTGISFISIIGLVANMSDYDYYDDYDYPSSDRNNNSAAALFALMYVGNYIWSVIDAPVSATRINKQNLLTWNVGKNTTLSIKPDFNYQSYNIGGYRSFEPSCGAKLTLNLR